MQGGSTLAIPIGYMQGGSTFAILIGYIHTQGDSKLDIPIGYMQGGSTQGGIKKARNEDEIEIQGRKVYLYTVVVAG
jgi:hypothetical protein